MPGWARRAAGPGQVGVRLDHHSLAASRSQVLPPADPGGHRVRVRGVHPHSPGHGDQARGGAGQPVSQAEMPAVITLVVDGALGGQYLEGGQPHPVQAVHRPAVLAVGGGERPGVGGPGPGPRGECGHVHSPRGGLREQAHGVRQRGPRGGADRGVLVPQQVPGLDRPGHQLAVEQHPAGAQLVPEPGGGDPGAHRVQQLAGGRGRALFRAAWARPALFPGLAYGPARRTAARSGCTPRRACRLAPRTGPGPSPRPGRRAARPASPCAFPRRARR